MAQIQWSLNIGVNKISPKRNFVYYPQATKISQDALLSKPDNTIGFCFGIGLRKTTRLFRYEVGYELKTFNYTLKPKLEPSELKINTSLKYFSHHTYLTSGLLIRRYNLVLGLGIDLQYLTKPRITSDGPESHNIVDNNVLSLGGIVSGVWDFKIKSIPFFIGYTYTFYQTGRDPISIQLVYNKDYRNLFIHNPDFNMHTLKIGYVFTK